MRRAAARWVSRLGLQAVLCFAVAHRGPQEQDQSDVPEPVRPPDSAVREQAQVDVREQDEQEQLVRLAYLPAPAWPRRPSSDALCSLMQIVDGPVLLTAAAAIEWSWAARVARVLRPFPRAAAVVSRLLGHCSWRGLLSC